MKKLLANIKESYDELIHKVSWPTKSELSTSTDVVMTASLIIALVIFAMDQCFEHILRFVYQLIY